MIYNIIEFIKNKYFYELKEYSPFVRQAMIFKYVTEEIPLKITDTDKIAGWYEYENAGSFELEENKFYEHTHILNSEQKQLLEHLRNDLKIEINFTPAHTCIDYETIIQKGLEHYIRLVDNALYETPDNDCLKAMRLSLEAACNYALRFAEKAKEKAETTSDKYQKARFKKIYSSLCQVPRYGARNFLEAVQSVWIMHSLIPLAEMSWASISIGRIDQYLYPFYKKHISEGGSINEVKDILKNLFILLDSYGDGACAMNIGGMNENGCDMINDFSKLLIEVEKEMSLRAPIFAARVTPNMPDEVLDSLIDFDLFKIGQPTFYGELNCRKAVADRGVNHNDAVEFSVNSCMGLIVAGKEFSDMWGIKFNSHLPLELALNGGKPLNCNIAIELGVNTEEITDFEQLLKQYENYFSRLLTISAGIYEAKALENEANTPDPLLSALTDGCIKSRRDRANGATYNTVTIEMMGLINTCDSLAAINELVFKQKKYTLCELLNSAKMNYEGYEDIHSNILKCSKYGTNDSIVNTLFKRLCKIVSKSCKSISHANRMFLPSLHTIDANISYGLDLYATLDGRRQGQPVNKNANPSILLKSIAHTSQVLSATAFDQSEFSGGQPIDLYFDKAWFKTKENRDKIKALIRTYFKLGGLQLQVNSIDIELLEKAHNSPEDYPFVIIRKGGYSVRFNEMSKQGRAEFIELAKRAEQL